MNDPHHRVGKVDCPFLKPRKPTSVDAIVIRRQPFTLGVIASQIKLGFLSSSQNAVPASTTGGIINAENQTIVSGSE